MTPDPVATRSLRPGEDGSDHARGDPVRLQSARFRREREASWLELDAILRGVEKRGMGRLAADEIYRLPTLYRSVVSSLSVARAISLDRNLLDYLEALTSRAYLLVYTSKKPGRRVIHDFLASSFPAAVYRLRHHVLAATLLLGLGLVCGLVLTHRDPSRYYSFVPAEFSEGRTPDTPTEDLRRILYRRDEALDSLTHFASMLFSHNARIGITCFALGFVAGVPVVLLVFYNGAILGAMLALYQSRGLGSEFLAWVGAHGVTELGAVCLCAGAGLALGGALLFPGPYTRPAHLAIVGRRTAPVVVGAVGLFLIAALIEGYFRQLVTSVAVRWIVAIASLAFWGWLFGSVGRRAADRGGAS